MSCAVIIPAYNAAAYLAEAIDSAIRQTTPARSIVVVDDGSTDGTSEICERYGDAVISLRQSNQGVSVARNHGANQVSAEWLLFLDADDRLTDVALGKLLARTREDSFGVTYGRTTYFDTATGVRRDHGTAGLEGEPPAGARASFWKSAITTPGAALIRADLFREIGGFDPVVNSLADRDFWMKAGVTAKFGFVPEVVIEKREHGQNMSGNIDRTLLQSVQVQLGFFDWCRARRVATEFLEASPASVIDNALRKGLQKRRLDAVVRILELAARHDVRSPTVDEARRCIALPRFAADLRLRLKAGLRSLARFVAP